MPRFCLIQWGQMGNVMKAQVAENNRRVSLSLGRGTLTLIY